MASKYDPRRYGRTSQANPADDFLRQAWKAVPTRVQVAGDRSEWVPRETVFSDDSISPREGANVDTALVREYAANFASLPPIRVQRGTFRLIDGKHRLQASFETAANTLFILIEECDVEDEDMFMEAFRANAAHGRLLTLRDRQRYFDRLFRRFGTEWTDGEYARETGLSRNAAMDRRHRLEPPKPGKQSNISSTFTPTSSGNSTQREENHNRSVKPPVRSFDPGAESEPDDPFYDNDAADIPDDDGVNPGVYPGESPAVSGAADDGNLSELPKGWIPEGMSAEEAELFGYGKQPEPTYMRKPDVYEPLSAAQADFLVASFERIAKRALWIDRDWYELTTEQRGRVRACVDDAFAGVQGIMQELKSAAVGGS